MRERIDCLKKMAWVYLIMLILGGIGMIAQLFVEKLTRFWSVPPLITTTVGIPLGVLGMFLYLGTVVYVIEKVYHLEPSIFSGITSGGARVRELMSSWRRGRK